MFKYFEGCDPVASGDVQFSDQIIPFLVIKLFRSVPGISGLFVAAAYSGMLRYAVCLRTFRLYNKFTFLTTAASFNENFGKLIYDGNSYLL